MLIFNKNYQSAVVRKWMHSVEAKNVKEYFTVSSLFENLILSIFMNTLDSNCMLHLYYLVKDNCIEIIYLS